MAQNDDKQLLTAAEFAAKSHLSLSTVRRRVAEGNLPTYQPGGKGTAVRIPASALESKPAADNVDGDRKVRCSTPHWRRRRRAC